VLYSVSHLHSYKAFKHPIQPSPYSGLLDGCIGCLNGLYDSKCPITLIRPNSFHIHGDGMITNRPWCVVHVHCCNDGTFIVVNTIRGDSHKDVMVRLIRCAGMYPRKTYCLPRLLNKRDKCHAKPVLHPWIMMRPTTGITVLFSEMMFSM